MAGENVIVERTLSLLKEGDKQVKLGKHRDVVLILGNTGSGKTTLMQFITGDNAKLRSEEVGEDTGEFLIVDEQNKISSNSTILSQTIFPDLVVHEETHTAFYDCPGFNDTRSTANDIVAAYFVHMVIKHAESVKLLFVVNYHSVKEGVDRRDFLSLLQHVINFIPNVNEFKNSIALIVTKVDNRMFWKKGVPMFVPDSKEISNIAQFLESAKASIKFITKDESPEKEQFNENAIKLIDIFLTKDNENYSRIALFRRPNQSGLLSEIPSLQNEKYCIEKMIEKDLKFTVNNVKNFGFAISAESRNEIEDIVATINKQITGKIACITQRIENFYANYVKQTDDIYLERNTFTKAYKVLSSTVRTTQFPESLTKFLKTIISDMKTLDIHVSAEILEEIITLDNHLHFLQMITSKDLSRTADWLKPLEETVMFLKSSKAWYDFLIDLYERLSKYDVQENKAHYKVAELQENLKNLQKKNIKIKGDSLKEFLSQVYKENVREKCLIPGFEDIKALEINEFRLKNLNKVLDATFHDVTTTSCAKSNELIIHGSYVKMSEVSTYLSENKRSTKIESLKIFSSNKIFIDTDFVQVGSKLLVTIIAPTWEIIGDRRITLDGESGSQHSRKANNGIFRDIQTTDGIGLDGMNGDDGLPGVTGGSAGSFFGIGDNFINGNHLKVTANGGHGSNGQDGGDGADGAKGRDATWDQDLPGDDVVEEDHSKLILLVYNKWDTRVKKLSRPGGRGGNGGNGGRGGDGGNEGEIIIYGLSGKPNVQTEKLKGSDGINGKGGKGGSGGFTGDCCTANNEVHYILFFRINSNWTPSFSGVKSNTRMNSGTCGRDGFNEDGFVKAEEARRIQDPCYIVNDYKNYLRQCMYKNLNRKARDFYKSLGDDINVKKFYNTLGLINEFQGLENQYYSLNGYIEFIPIYRCLMRRVEEYAHSPKDNEDSKTYKNVLGYLYAAILSKICGMKKNGKSDMVVNIAQYLNLITDNIKQFQQLSKSLIMKEYNANYKEMVDDKITEAADLINNYIKNQLNDIQQQISEEINILVNEIPKLKTKTEEERENLLMKKREQTKRNELKVLTAIMEGISNALIFLTHVAGGGKTLVDAVNMMANRFGFVVGSNKLKSFNILQQIINGTDKFLIEISKKNEKLGKETSVDVQVRDEEIMHLNDKLNAIKSYEKKILDLILPMMKTVRNDLHDLQPKLKNMSQVSLEISKWNVQRTLRDVKSYMRHIITQLELRENITSLYERLNEGIDLLINVYNRMQTYIDQKTFADYIANINLTEPINMGNTELQYALTHLQLSIKSNIILGQYEKATSALTQFMFPFAEFYVADFRLPSFIQVNEDLADITSNAVRQIQSLRMKLIESEASIQKHDKYIHYGYFYYGNEYLGPFYTWRNEQYGNDIKALLSGEKVLLKADIMKSNKKNAIKFNEIGITFKVHDDQLQEELDEKLKYFDVSMTHLGNSYYRCDGRYYVISSNAETLRYSFARVNQSTPASENLVYNKLKSSPCMLSPYATWMVQLSIVSKADFTILEKFGNLADLELIGYGQYVQSDIDICDHKLNVYYQESDISDMDNLYERLKWQEGIETNSSNVEDGHDIVPIDLNNSAYGKQFGVKKILNWFRRN